MSLTLAGATLATGALGAFSSLLGGLFGLNSQSSTNAVNERIAQNTNQTNFLINQQTNALNEKLQREQWERDDHSYQRAVQDMQAAGLNPLAGVSPQSSPLSTNMQAAQMQPYTLQPLDFSFMNNLGELLILNKQLQQRDKEINLRSIASGIDPSNLTSGYESILNDYKNAIKALGDLRANQSSEAAKNASSPYVKGEGIFSQTSKDFNNFAKTGVKVLDSVLGSEPKTVTGERKPLINRSGQSAFQGDSKSVESYYYNKSQKNKLSLGQRVKNRFNRFLNSGK